MFSSWAGKSLFRVGAGYPSLKVCATPLKLITVKLPEKLIDDVDQLVKAGMYHNRSDAIRAAVRDMLRRELWRTEQG